MRGMTDVENEDDEEYAVKDHQSGAGVRDGRHTDAASTEAADVQERYRPDAG